MLKVLSCLTTEHDPRLVLVAALVCVVSAVTAFEIYHRALQTRQLARFAWFALAGFSAGSGIWTTHFIAMLAYEPGLKTGYAADVALLSLTLAVAGTVLAFWIASRTTGRLRAAAGGLALSGGVAVMHYTGMAAFRTEGQPAWDPSLVVASLLIGAAFAVAAFAAARDASTLKRRAAGAACMVLSICGLHFTGMAAVTITPDPTVAPPPSLLSSGTMAGALVLLVGLVMLTAVGVLVVEARSKGSAYRRLQEAIEAMPGGFAIYDAEDRLQLWNGRYTDQAGGAADLLRPGVRFAELLRRRLERGEFPEAAGREEAWVTERLEARRMPRGSFEQRCGDRWLRLDERRTADGGALCVVMDVTDLKRDAEALAEARDQAEAANRAKSEFLANMSHEIRTPLNGVLGLAGALARSDLTVDQREMVRTIETSAAALERVLTDVLDLARIEAGRTDLRAEPFDVGETVRDAAALFELRAREKGLEFGLTAPTTAFRGIGDAARLRQILLNLLDNAVKFTEAGRVDLTAGPTTNGQWRFQVRDTGPGFAPEFAGRLFDRFTQADGSHTRRHGGSGLGLAIAAELATAMGGRLTAESRPGAGATFTLEIPLAQAPEAEAPPAAEPAVVDFRRARILLVEDNPTNRKVVEVMLAGLEVDLVATEDGAQAVEAYAAAPFDAVLMDMQMPVMDGLDATRAIRALESREGRPRTPVLILSANAMPEHVEASRQAGADRHLAKPIRLADLHGAVGEALAGSSERRAA